MTDPNTSQRLTQQEVAQEYTKHAAKTLATLLAVFGQSNLQLAEDCLQEVYIKAVQSWSEHGLPENPGGWLTTTAKHAAIDVIRRNKREHLTDDLSDSLSSEWTMTGNVEKQMATVEDEELSLMLWIAESDVPINNQLPMMLRYVCGLSNDLIAQVLMISSETLKKRLQRTKKQLATIPFYQSLHARERAKPISDEALTHVQLTIYLLYTAVARHAMQTNEKHQSVAIQAIGMSRMLSEAPATANSESLALYALLHFHHARLPARQHQSLLTIPLDDQQRASWHQPLIVDGSRYLAMAIETEHRTAPRFLLEALIAYEHCRAKQFSDTKWDVICDHYRALTTLTQSPLHFAGWAISCLFAAQIDAAKQIMNQHRTVFVDGFEKYALAISAFIASLENQVDEANQLLAKAIEAGLSPDEAKALEQRLAKGIAQ